MDPLILAKLNELMGRESNSANFYQALFTYFHSNNLPGYSNRMQLRVSRKQSRVTQIQQFITSSGANPGGIPNPAPIPPFTNPIDALKFINLDQTGTKQLMDQIIAMANQPINAPIAQFVRSLVEEQTEEEATASELLERSKTRYAGRNIQLIPIDYNLP